MTCRYCRKQMSSYMEEELSPRARKEFEEHLSGCPKCVDLLSSVRKTVRMLSRLPLSAPSSSFGFILRGRLLMELNPRRRPSGWRLGPLHVPRGLPVFVGAAAIAVLALSIGLKRSDQPSPTPEVARSDALNVGDHYYVLGRFSPGDLLRDSSSSQISLDRTPVPSDSLLSTRRVQRNGSSRVLLVSF